jgi:polar amino acid transport system substrate-binding protein
MILYYLVFGKVGISAIIVAIIGFSINFGVYVSEMISMGINAVEKGQIEAAAALGFTRSQVFRKVTFPQAAQHFVPIYKGAFISMVKDTSVVGYIAIEDLTKVSDIIRSRTLEAFFPLIVTAVIYYLVANLLAFVLTKIEIRINPKKETRIAELTER